MHTIFNIIIHHLRPCSLTRYHVVSRDDKKLTELEL